MITPQYYCFIGLDKISFPRSCHTYDGHRGAITGVAVLENSHTVASCSDDGSIHVWRVDVATSAPGSGAEEGYDHQIILDVCLMVSFYSIGNASNNSNDDSMRAEVSQKVNVGVSEIKQIKSEEGSVVAIQHYNGDIASVITYLTQHGGLHGWDMRSTTEAFNFNLRPELGSPTCLTLAPDRNWICVGTL
jgi:phosphoinositide-3-kinase regulatory subunit 4